MMFMHVAMVDNVFQWAEKQVWHLHHFAAVLCENVWTHWSVITYWHAASPTFSLSLSLHADVFSPLAIFIPRISYHSATVRWATAHINVSFNHTYYITYSILSSTPTSNESVMADHVQHTATGDVYSVNLSSLLRNATYVSTIVSASEIYREMRFSGPTISTLPYRKLSDILHMPFGLSLLLLTFISHCH